MGFMNIVCAWPRYACGDGHAEYVTPLLTGLTRFLLYLKLSIEQDESDTACHKPQTYHDKLHVPTLVIVGQT